MKSVRNAAWCLLACALITFCTGILYASEGAPFVFGAGFMMIPALIGLAVTNPRIYMFVVKDYNLGHEAFKRLRVAMYGILASLALIACGVYIDVHRYGWFPVTLGILSALMHLTVLYEHRKLFVK